MLPYVSMYFREGGALVARRTALSLVAPGSTVGRVAAYWQSRSGLSLAEQATLPGQEPACHSLSVPHHHP
jgi:hypothetical protein